MITTSNIYFLLIYLLAFYTIKRFFDSAKDSRDMQLLALQLGTPVSKDVIALLDDFLSDVFDDYLLSDSRFVQDVYISEDSEIQMRSEVIDLIADRMSPYMYQKLAVYYNEKTLPDVIAGKVYQLVTAYVIGKNQVKSSKEDL